MMLLFRIGYPQGGTNRAMRKPMGSSERIKNPVHRTRAPILEGLRLAQIQEARQFVLFTFAEFSDWDDSKCRQPAKGFGNYS